jgi:hypothetical protein
VASARVVDKELIKQTRYMGPKSLNPMGLGIVYSIEFKADFYNKPERNYVYVGISNQVDTTTRLTQHRDKAKKVGEEIKNLGYDFQMTSKPTYIALGAAFAANPKLEAQYLTNIAKIVNVVSLFDMAAMEKKYIADNKLQQKFNKSNSVNDLAGLAKGKKDFYGLNDAVGGEGTAEKQSTTLSSLEWLFAAYYYVTEKDKYITDERDEGIYKDNDSLIDKMYKVIENARRDPVVKILKIERDEVEKFAISMNLLGEKSYLTGRVDIETKQELSVKQMFEGNNDILLEIATKVESDGTTRDSRNILENYIRDKIFRKNGIKQTEVIKILTEFEKNTNNTVLNNSLDRISQTAVNKALKKIQNLKTSKDFQKQVEEDGLDVAIENIQNSIKEEFPNFNPNDRFIRGVNKKIFASKQIRKLLVNKIILIVEEEVRKGLITFTGNELGRLIEKDTELEKQVIRQITGGTLEIDGQRITVQYNKTSDVKQSDIAKAELVNGKWTFPKKSESNALSDPRGNKK